MPKPATPLPPGFEPLPSGRDPAGQRQAIAVIVIGALLLGGCWWLNQPADNPSVAPRPATATTRPATTVRLDRCSDDLADMQDTIRLVQLELDWFAQSAAVADVAGAQVHYDNAMLLGEVAIDRVDAFLAECGSYARAAGTYSDMRQGSATAESALAEMRRTCRADLAQFGFDC